MITDDKITEIFCTVDEFSKNFDSELEKNLLSASSRQRRRRKATMSDSEIMTVQLMFHLGGYKCFKHFYIHYILGSRRDLFPTAVSYNRFVELESRVFFVMMFFLKMSACGRCNGVSYVDATMIPVCHIVRRYMNKVFDGFANDGKGTMGWCHGFKLHFVCNDQAEIITFCLTTANTDDRDPKVWKVLAKDLYGKLFADRGYISQRLFDDLFEDGIHLVTGIKSNMKNKLMPLWDKIMLRKRYVIECINDTLKNTESLVHSRHRSINNFIMNLVSALGAYCFYDNKPHALSGFEVVTTNQLSLF